MDKATITRAQLDELLRLKYLAVQADMDAAERNKGSDWERAGKADEELEAAVKALKFEYWSVRDDAVYACGAVTAAHNAMSLVKAPKLPDEILERMERVEDELRAIRSELGRLADGEAP